MAALKNNNNKTYKRVRCGAFSFFFFFSDFSWAMGVTCERSRCWRRLLFITFSGILFLQSLPPAVFGRVKPQGLALAGGWCGSHSSKRCPVAGQQLCICLWREEEQLCPYPREWIELKNLWDYFTLSPTSVLLFNCSPFSEQFWRGLIGGGKIYFKLLSSLIHILFMMYFYQQYFVIQLPLLNVTWIKNVITFLSVT